MIVAKDIELALDAAYRIRDDADRKAIVKVIAGFAERGFRTKAQVAKSRCRYPQDKEAIALLKEARRRHGSETYQGCSREEVIRQMLQENGVWTTRMRYGKLKGSKGVREHTIAVDDNTAIKNWGKHLAAYEKRLNER